MSTVKCGFVIPFVQDSTPAFIKDNRSALDKSEFAEENINDLLNSNFVVEVSERPYVVNPLKVSMSASRKERLNIGPKACQ